MKISDNVWFSVLAASALACLGGCSQVVDALGDIDLSKPQPGPSSAPPSEPPPREGACGCAISDALRPLNCSGGEVPLLDNDVVHASVDGRVAVFNICTPDYDCQVLYWEGGDTARVVGSGLLIDVSESGRQILSSGATGLSFLDLDYERSGTLPLDALAGHDSVTANGDAVFGAQYIEGRTQLVRANTASGAIEVLGTLDEAIARAYVSPDGSNVVGWGLDLEFVEDDVAFRWSEAAGFTFGLPGAPSDPGVWPESLSDDGSAIAGRSPQSGAHFYWSEAGGYLDLGPASWRSETFISGDGSVVLGSLDAGERDSSAFRWTQETGVVELAPDRSSLALGMSDDGAVVAAYSWEDAQIDGASPEDTFVWDAEQGTRTLDEILASRGVDVSGWEFGHPRALSGDGRVLLGRALCGGTPTLYRLVLSD
jgi:hypothetical protein